LGKEQKNNVVVLIGTSLTFNSSSR